MPSESSSDWPPEASRQLEIIILNQGLVVRGLARPIIGDNVQIWMNLEGEERRVEYLTGSYKIISDRGNGVDFRFGHQPSNNKLL